jgi:hypothetical protein
MVSSVMKSVCVNKEGEEKSLHLAILSAERIDYNKELQIIITSNISIAFSSTYFLAPVCQHKVLCSTHALDWC